MQKLSEKSVRLAIVGTVAALWLGLSGFALYSFQTAGQRLFDPQVMASEDSFSVEAAQRHLRELVQNTASPTLIFPWDPACSCSPAAVEHLISTAELLTESGTQVTLLVKPKDLAAGQDLAAQLRQTTGLEHVTVREEAGSTPLIASSPGAFLLGQNQELVYFGPWSSGGACVTGIGGFVESALLALDTVSPHPVVNRAAVGCYCQWNDPVTGAG